MWIIRDSFLSRNDYSDVIRQTFFNKNAVRLMSLIVDEAYFMCRSKKFNRVQVFRYITSRAAEFVILMLEIMFSLGLKQDARGILESCREDINDCHAKWNNSNKEIIRALLSSGNWNILANL